MLLFAFFLSTTMQLVVLVRLFVGHVRKSVGSHRLTFSPCYWWLMYSRSAVGSKSLYIQQEVEQFKEKGFDAPQYHDFSTPDSLKQYTDEELSKLFGKTSYARIESRFEPCALSLGAVRWKSRIDEFFKE